jgi:ribonucleoside-diphosphate reductase subunit M2
MIDSPTKKLNFGIAGKENIPFDSTVPNADIETKKPISEDAKTEKKAAVVPTIKPEEIDEPLLQENPQRFVLFPIKYHEVRVVVLDLCGARYRG